MRGVENVNRQGAGQRTRAQFLEVGGAFGALGWRCIRGMIEDDNYATLPRRSARLPEARVNRVKREAERGPLTVRRDHDCDPGG